MLDPRRQYEVVFRGELLPGFTLETVKPALAKIFSADSAQIQQLFSGKRVVIKTGLDDQSAEKYQLTLQKAGLYVELHPLPAVSSSQTANTTTSQDELPLWTIMEAGSILGLPAKFTNNPVDVPNYTVAEVGVVLGELPRHTNPVEVSIEHLKVLPLS